MIPTDPHPAGPSRFLGKPCSFDYEGKRLVGVVEAAVWAGMTTRGAIPDYSLTIRGQSGATIAISLVEAKTSFQ